MSRITSSTSSEGTSTSAHHQVLIVGGGQGGLSVAARLRRAGIADVAVVEPSTDHYYQPLWTLVGAGLVDVDRSVRPQRRLIPSGTRWIGDHVVGLDPDEHTVSTAGGGRISYDRLVVAPGLQLDWAATPGLPEAVAEPQVASNYDPELAPKTWNIMRGLRRGTAVFTMPPGPVKCPGAPQKIAYLCADHWRAEGVLNDIRVILAVPGGALFGIDVFREALERTAERYGIEVRYNTEVTEIDGHARRLTLHDTVRGVKEPIDYDALHVVPHQGAPDWLKINPVADPSSGFVDVDKHTLRHVRYPEVFALGDAGNTPNSKTGAAVRRQAPVVATNLLASLRDLPLTSAYDGYAACPLTTARNRVLLAEFDYTLTHRPSFPRLDTTRPRYDMWLLKRYGLPWFYWNVLLRGRA